MRTAQQYVTERWPQIIGNHPLIEALAGCQIANPNLPDDVVLPKVVLDWNQHLARDLRLKDMKAAAVAGRQIKEQYRDL